jgi:hypothetical protein
MSTFCSVDLLLQSTFCGVNVLSCRRFVYRRFVNRRFVIRRFVNRFFVCLTLILTAGWPQEPFFFALSKKIFFIKKPHKVSQKSFLCMTFTRKASF